MVGFIEYNEDCRFQESYMVPFETWAWDHETTHMANAVTYAKEWQYPHFDPRAYLESVVRPSAQEIDGEAQDRLEYIPECVGRAAATHGHLSLILDPFPGLPDTTWFWATGQGQFQENPPGWIWWDAGEDPFSSPCVN